MTAGRGVDQRQMTGFVLWPSQIGHKRTFRTSSTEPIIPCGSGNVAVSRAYGGHSWIVVETSNSTCLVVRAIRTCAVGLVTVCVKPQNFPGTVSRTLATNVAPSSRIDANSIPNPPVAFVPALATRSVYLSKSIGGSGIGG